MKRFNFLLFGCLFLASNVWAQVNEEDSLALVDLYKSTHGAGWNHNDNWLTAKPVSTWYGVGIVNNRVDFLKLYANNLKGNLPLSIGNLTAITHLDFYSNQLKDGIPPTFGNCTGLIHFVLSYNEFTGNIPPTLGNCIHLVDLWLERNQLTGNIPATLGKCTSLVDLRLHSNQLTGIIPYPLGNCRNLRHLYLNLNQLSGSIPASFSKLKKCDLYLQDNQLSGLLIVSSATIHNFVQIKNNYYNFSAFEPAISWYSQLRYAPQKPVPIHESGNKLSVSAGGTLSNNTYKWYKNGLLIKTATGDSSLTTTGAGKYTATITNSIVTLLTLQSDTIAITATTQNASSVIQNHVFNIFPNPSSTGRFTIDLGSVRNDISITITDNNGKEVYAQKLSAAQIININTSLQPGVYYLKSRYEDGEEEGKIITR